MSDPHAADPGAAGPHAADTDAADPHAAELVSAGRPAGTTPQTADASDDARASASNGWSSDPDSPTTTSDHPLSVVADVPGRNPVIPGHISIAPRVLQKVGGAVVGEALHVDHRDVRVEAHDDDGRLALSVSTPMSIPALSADVAVPAGGVLGSIRELQQTVTTRLFTITGRAVSSVDVTVTASRRETTTTGRVR